MDFQVFPQGAGTGLVNLTTLDTLLTGGVLRRMIQTLRGTASLMRFPGMFTGPTIISKTDIPSVASIINGNWNGC